MDNNVQTMVLSHWVNSINFQIHRHISIQFRNQTINSLWVDVFLLQFEMVDDSVMRTAHTHTPRSVYASIFLPAFLFVVWTIAIINRIFVLSALHHEISYRISTWIFFHLCRHTHARSLAKRTKVFFFPAYSARFNRRRWIEQENNCLFSSTWQRASAACALNLFWI